MMEAECLRIITWLEKSGHLPDDAVDDLDCAKDDLENSIRDFIGDADRLSESDYSEPVRFAACLMSLNTRVQDLRNEIQSIEKAIKKTVRALPDNIVRYEGLGE